MNQTGIIIGVAAGLVILTISWNKRTKIHANDIASFATTAGILCTFVGIVWALWGLTNLEEANVQQKIDSLLGGIYTAFIPSIFGSSIAVWTHIKPDFWRKPIEETDVQETDINAQILQELRRLNTNIVGDNETSLITRIEKFQLKVTDNQDALRKEFQQFAENVANNIIEALRQSMAELNEKLGKTFGENFGRFADVIPKLLEWQEHYRETIEDTQQQLKTQSDRLNGLLESLERTRQSFQEISDHANKIADSSTAMATTIPAIADSLTEAAQAIATVKADTEQLQMAVGQLTENLAEQTLQTKKQMTAIEQSATSITLLANGSIILDENVRQLNTAISTMTAGLASVDRLSDTLQGKAESIEQNMKNLTDKTLQSLASNLLGISEALVADYQKIHEIVKRISGMVP